MCVMSFSCVLPSAISLSNFPQQFSSAMRGTDGTEALMALMGAKNGHQRRGIRQAGKDWGGGGGGQARDARLGCQGGAPSSLQA